MEKSELIKATPRPATLLDMRLDPERFPRLKNYSREDAVVQMSRIVSQAFMYKGLMADDNNVKFISGALVDELMSASFGAENITFGEISIVVKRAVLGESEMYGISVSSLFKVIMEYCKGEGTRLQEEAKEIHQRRKLAAYRATGVNPLIQAAAGKFINNQKNNK